MEKTIFINWRWEPGTNKNLKELIIEDGKSKIIFTWFSNKDNTNNLEEIINLSESNEKLVLLHRDNNILTSDLKKLANICQDFGGGDEAIYFHKGGLIHTGEDYRNIDVLEGGLKKLNNLKNRFETVWNKYSFEPQKKKLINHWLPLAIDLQGLSEVQSDTKKAIEYFEAVKGEEEYLASLESFPNNKEGKNEDFPLWQEIKEKLQNGYKDFNPVELVNEIKNKSFTEFDKKYFTDPNFLPNWLQKVVRVIDEKISKSK